MATDWIQTLQNRALFPRAIKPDQVGTIAEIAHSLSQNYRFTRQLSAPYSVAEHCVRGARLMPKAFAGAFLLHELSEVYLPDIPAPLKPFVLVDVGATEADGALRTLKTWAELEREHTRVMLEALGLSSIEPLIYSPEVRAMDLAMLAAEKRWLVGPEPMPWGLNVEPPELYASMTIAPWKQWEACDQFVAAFKDLFR